jgi:hypothetical protein
MRRRIACANRGQGSHTVVVWVVGVEVRLVRFRLGLGLGVNGCGGVGCV